MNGWSQGSMLAPVLLNVYNISLKRSKREVIDTNNNLFLVILTY